jgi:HK97 family phage prohead protease
MEILAVGLEVKFAAGGSPGFFEGYGSVANIIDDHNDRVAEGAFASSLSGWKTKGYLPPMYFQHGPMLGGPAEPVGVWDDMAEDSKGLHVKGRMLGLETDIGRYRYELVKGGAMRGLSIGYKTEKADFSKEGNKTIRTLKQVKLREVSIVDDPANSYARVHAIKAAAAQISTIREFEDFLRDVGGFSREAAKSIASGGFKAKPDPRDEAGAVELVNAIQALAGVIKP